MRIWPPSHQIASEDESDDVAAADVHLNNCLFNFALKIVTHGSSEN